MNCVADFTGTRTNSSPNDPTLIYMIHTHSLSLSLTFTQHTQYTR